MESEIANKRSKL